MKKHPFFSMAIMFLIGIVLYDNIALFLGTIQILIFSIVFIVAVLFLIISHKRRGNILPFVVIVLFIPFILGMFKIHVDTGFRNSYINKINNEDDVLLQGKIYKKEKKNMGYCYYLKDVYLNNVNLNNANLKNDNNSNSTVKRGSNNWHSNNRFTPKDSSDNLKHNCLQKHVNNSNDTNITKTSNIDTNVIKTNNVIAYFQTDECFMGEKILISGKIKLFEDARNEGNFDSKQFYFSQKIDYSIINSFIQKRTIKSNQYLEKLYNTKNKISNIYFLKLDEINAGTLSNMILGEKSNLDKGIKENYKKLGLSHILSISGMHVSFFGLGLYYWLRKLGITNKSSACLSIFSVISYGYLTGMSISSIRAIGMIILMIIANLIGRTYDTINSIGIMLIFLMWNNPFLYANSGFQMSFMAVFSIATLGKSLTYKLDKNKSKIIEKAHSNSQKPNAKKIFIINLKKKILVSFSIQIMILPIMLNSYFEISPYSFLVNLILLPLVEYIFVSGVAGGIIGLVLLSFSKAFLMPADIILSLYTLVCNCFVAFPYSTIITGEMSKMKTIVYYVVLLILYIIIKSYSKIEEDVEFINPKIKKLYLRKIVILSIILFSVALIRLPLGFEVDVLDVGQGDGIFISTSDNYKIFIDGGSTDEKEVGNYKILPFLKSKGINKIDYWFISHGDADHISGFLEILEEGYRVKNLILSKTMPKDEAYKKIIKLAKEKNVNIIYVEAKDELRLKEAKIKFLYPYSKNEYSKEEQEDRNLLSLCFVLKDKEFIGLFAGDLNGEKEGDLDVPNDIFFYKAIHHGSKFSNTSELLKKIKPSITCVSCGRNNRYGHPNKEAISRIKEECSNIFYTTKGGQIKIKKNKSSFVVKRKLSVIK
ncbi:DNA internalization-related competence protein ComEC/Rec2 [Lachnobacterium bovis]|uniref:DNA internalization-related competence protein ComEC/Rec2 n=1 Tax=Lachnobacterium bovis TaxID=140626 RepID=UPI00048490DA|nr:DNA internalization-related competence protein ComEC/Rec2 [Lachnobacterium bovis]